MINSFTDNPLAMPRGPQQEKSPKSLGFNKDFKIS